MSIRKTGIIVVVAVGVFAASVSYAQGRSGGQDRGQAPSQMRDSARQDSMRRDMKDMRARSEERRHEAEAKKAEAEARHEEAEARRAAAEANSRGEDSRAEHGRSTEARAEHPPNEQAAPEAFLAEENALNAELAERRKDLPAENRGGRGPDDDSGDDD